MNDLEKAGLVRFCVAASCFVANGLITGHKSTGLCKLASRAMCGCWIFLDVEFQTERAVNHTILSARPIFEISR